MRVRLREIDFDFAETDADSYRRQLQTIESSLNPGEFIWFEYVESWDDIRTACAIYRYETDEEYNAAKFEHDQDQAKRSERAARRKMSKEQKKALDEEIEYQTFLKLKQKFECSSK